MAGRQRKLLGEDELALIEGMIEKVIEFGDGKYLVKREAPIENFHLLIEGFVLGTIESEGRRYIVGINVPGDFLDLQGLLLNHLTFNLVSAGSIKVGSVPRERLRTVVRDRPNIARAMWIATLLDAAIHRRWIQILGQLDAPRLIAHHFAELHERLELIGHKIPRVLRTPFSQADLGDMCGVSTVHANRAVGKLRDLGVCEIRRGNLYTADWAELKRYACFDGRYLYGENPSVG